MKTDVARFVTRLQGDEDGLILGAMLGSGKDFLKPNFVYNLIKCHLTGDLILRPIGECCIFDLGYSWAFETQTILDRCQPYIFLSREELKESVREGEIDV